MDYSRNHPGAIGRNKSQPPAPFHRAYKACIPCRNKKAKCNITAEEYATGRPCAKCRREMRRCVFTADRNGPRQRRRTSSDISTAPLDRSPRSLRGSDIADASPQVVDANAQEGSNLADAMIRTVVSNGNDALNLLFEAASQDDQDAARLGRADIISQSPAFSTAQSTSADMIGSISALPKISSELWDIWNAYRFVKMGWFSAEEAVWFLDISHFDLVTQEPLLTCMLLTISSRYHTLPVVGGHSRGYLIHQRLWDHCQSLLMRIVLGLEKSSKAKTRTLGSIEALLLLTEWHPRALHAPPPNDGWDSDVMLTLKDQRDQNGTSVDHPSRDRWLEDVILPAKRSDRMSWMVLGCAVSLGSELGLFDDQSDNNSFGSLGSDAQNRSARPRLAKLIYVYQEQLSSRLGRRSMMHQSTSHAISFSKSPDMDGSDSSRQWPLFMSAWTGLTKIIRSISDLLFPSATVTNQILRSGRYITMIEHVQSLLAIWLGEHSEALRLESRLRDILMLEYQSTRIYTYSLGLQAIVSRTLAESNTTNPTQSTCFNLTSTDFGHLQELISSALSALKIVLKLANDDVLRFCPVKVFLQVTTASVFLLKGLGLGVSPTKLHEALDVLRDVVNALRTSNPDDLHLGARYATLLEVHLANLQRHFVPSVKPPELAPRFEQGQQMEGSALEDIHGALDTTNANTVGTDPFDEHWLSLPLDASLVPFELGDFQGLQCLGDGTLDFLWNLGA